MKSFFTALLWLGLTAPSLYGQNSSGATPEATTPPPTENSKAADAGAQPCSTATTLTCGQTLLNQTTMGFSSNFSTGSYNTNSCLAGLGIGNNAYNANDRVYKITLTDTTEINLSLHILTPNANLDMFLLDVCQPADCIAASISTSPIENIRITLPEGDYYLVVDGKGSTANFNLRSSCTCDCVESTEVGNLYACESFEGYQPGDSIAAVSNIWDKWSNTVADAPVATDGFGNYLKIAKVGNYEADVWYNFDTLKHGRYRLSFRMKVDNGKIGNYYVLHQAPNATGGNSNTAYRVRFNADNTGELFIGTSTSANATFRYANGYWTEVMQIIDINTNRAELWIDDQYIRSWQFSLGDPVNLNQLHAVNFDAHFTDFSYAIDDICLRARPEPCFTTTVYSPVCVKNGTQPNNSATARCQLYTPDEMEPCNTVCDIGGTFIYRGDNFSGVFTPSDRAPASLYANECVQEAYDFDIPPNLLADIYVFSREDDEGFSANANGNNNPNVRAFAFSCRRTDIFDINGGCINGEDCIKEIDTNGNTTDIGIDDCSPFYYLVVTGVEGETYSGLNVIPNGDCPSNPSEITCGSVLNGTIDFPFSDSFTVAGAAYRQCYNGSRVYTGGETFYKFVLQQPSKVTIKMTATGANPGAMGLFLFSFLCGETCLGYAENTDSDPSAILEATLSEGIYYLVVDKNLDNSGSSTFSLQLDCIQYSPFINQNTFLNGDFSDCPTDPGAQHQVAISYSPVYTGSDYFNFYFRDTDGKLKGNTEASRYWHNSTQPMYFDLNADVTGDGEKCSYAPGDTFYVFVHQTEDGKRNFKRYEPAYAPPSGGGATDSLVFRDGGFSLITKLTEVSAQAFGGESSFLRTDPDAKEIPFRFVTNLDWAVEKVNGSAPWLTINPTQNDVGKILKFIFSQHTSPIPRSVVLRFYSTEFPDIYRQFVTIEQQGPCIIPQAVNIVPSAVSVCAGTPVTLSADVGAAYEGLYHYKWNTGDTSRVITKTPSIGPNNYSVTITNKYCFITGSDAQSVTGNALPPAPTGPVDKAICEGQNNIPPLSVAPPGVNNQVFWYATSSGGDPLQPNPSNTYTPPAPVNTTTSYYAETKNAITGCVSATRTPVTLTVNSNPAIGTISTVCAPDLLTYTLTAPLSNYTGASTTPAYNAYFDNGQYIVTDIPKGTNVLLTAANPFCFVSQQVTAPACECPVVAAPVSEGDREYCAGMPVPPLYANVAPDEAIDWFTQSVGGDSLGSGSPFTPPGPGIYYARARKPVNNCVSATRTPVTLTLNALPTFSVISKTCSADLTKYDLVFASDATMATAPPYTPVNPGNGTFEIKNISAGSGISLHLDNTATDCTRDTTLEPHLCACPALAPPFNPVNVSVCAGTGNISPLQVSAGPGLLAKWYRNGLLQSATPSLSLNATVAGVYYAKTFDPVSNCESKDSTAVVLDIKPLPSLSEGAKACDPSWQIYQVTVSSSTPSLVSNPFIIPANNQNGTYTWYDVPIGSPLTVTASSANCTTSVVIQPPVCSCPYIPQAPFNPSNPVICLGSAPPALTVSVGVQSAETVDWYDAPTGGVKVESGSLEYQPNFAVFTDTFYAETRLIQFPNCVGPRTPVVLTVEQPVSFVNAGVDTAICADEKLPLNALVGTGAVSGTWTAEPAGGVFFPDASFIAAQTYTPPAGADTVILKLTAFPANQNVCPPKQDTRTLAVRPVPAITFINAICDADLNSYSILFGAEGDQIAFTPNIGDWSVNPDGSYTYGNIPEGQQVSITASYILTGCDTKLAPPAKNCDCPDNIPAPDPGDNQIVCEGATVYPPISAGVPPGMTVDWYDAPFGGQKLDSNTVYFTPPTPDVYYAETRDTLNGCVSLSRTPVALLEVPKPEADAGPDKMLCPGTTGTLSAFQSAGYTYQWSNGQTLPAIAVPAVAASYILTVTLGNCTAQDTVAVGLLPPVTASIAVIAAIPCHGDSSGVLGASASGGAAPFGYQWSNGSTLQIQTGLPAGVYTLTASNGQGCTDTDTLLLDEPAPLVLLDTVITAANLNQNDGSIQAEIAGGTPPYSYQWLLANGNPFSGQTDSLLAGVFAGTYLLQVTDQNNCKFVSPPLEVLVPADEPVLRDFVSVFPNPATGRFYIRFELPESREVEIRVSDVLGRNVLAARPGVIRSDVLEFDLSDMASGIYLLNIGLDGAFVNKMISLKK
jgi:hypothetical protein